MIIKNFILFIILFQGWTNVYCQTDTESVFKKTPIEIIPPKMKDFNAFKQNIPVADLKRIYDHLAKEGYMYVYEYIFSVDKDGKTLPYFYDDKKGYYKQNKILFAPVVEYIKKTFNWTSCNERKS